MSLFSCHEPAPKRRKIWQLDMCAQHIATEAATAIATWTPSPVLASPLEDDDEVQFVAEILPPSRKNRDVQLLDLPRELLFRLLKYYVPAQDKLHTLSRIPVFQNILQEPDLYFPSVRQLRNLEEQLPSGWYCCIYSDVMLHFAVNYETLAFYVDLYRVSLVSCEHFYELKAVPVWYQGLRRAVERLASPQRRPALRLVRDFLFYRFIHPYFQSVMFLWIFSETKRVRWSSDYMWYILEDQTCRLNCDGDNEMTIHLQPDQSLCIRFAGKFRRPKQIRTFPITYNLCAQKEKRPEQSCLCDRLPLWTSRLRVDWNPEKKTIDMDLSEEDGWLKTVVPELLFPTEE